MGGRRLARFFRSRGAPLERSLESLSLPPPRTSALLVFAFFGFGILVGDLVVTHSPYALSASRRPVRLILPSHAEASSRGTESDAKVEPPAASSQAAPEHLEPGPEDASGPPAAITGASGASGNATSTTRSAPRESQRRGDSANPKLPAIGHVFVIVLSEAPFANVFGPSSTAPYLAQTLEHRGELLVRYYGVARGPLANGVALVSGQGPTPQTAAGCPAFANIIPVGAAKQEQFAGEGCVYPAATKTLVGQLAARHLSARAYVQGIDEPGAGDSACAHPLLGAPDPTAEPSSTSAYATARNPFVYFHAILDSRECVRQDVGLGSLAHDLAKRARTPALSYIVPDRCDDGSPSPCAVGAPAGMLPSDALLRRIVPEILASSAYRRDGLLVITVDGAPTSGELADTSSCCGQPRFPNLPPPTGKAALLGPEGGGQVGALLLSPFVKPGTVSQEPYNHFSLLRTIEDLFGLAHIGYAASARVQALEPALFAGR
jgi:hypothetical protein